MNKKKPKAGKTARKAEKPALPISVENYLTTLRDGWRNCARDALNEELYKRLEGSVKDITIHDLANILETIITALLESDNRTKAAALVLKLANQLWQLKAKSEEIRFAAFQQLTRKELNDIGEKLLAAWKLRALKEWRQFVKKNPKPTASDERRFLGALLGKIIKDRKVFFRKSASKALLPDIDSNKVTQILRKRIKKACQAYVKAQKQKVKPVKSMELRGHRILYQPPQPYQRTRSGTYNPYKGGSRNRLWK